MFSLECDFAVTGGSTKRCQSSVFLTLILLLFSPFTEAFPPYKTTDADTADPYDLELRLGIIKVERAERTTDFVSPLLRMNFGLPDKIEVVSEFEYKPEQHELGDGAIGIKWAPMQGPLSFGVETLLLLPVRSGDDAVGLESQLLATWRGPDQGLRVHMNAGGFHDPRGSATENGWRASLLAEYTENSLRPGLELFVKQNKGQDADVRLGAGLIKDAGQFEIRTAVHIGITSQAPDMVFNVWLSMKLPFRKSPQTP